jgi:DNA-directed RNA polymerase subunit RPC12/RpoP
MSVGIICPVCGSQCRADSQGAVCPKCFTRVAAAQQPAPPILGDPNAGGQSPSLGAPNRTLLAEPEAMIRYTCARCQKSLESPVSFAGRKINCPNCNQRLQIPQPSTPSTTPPINKTILASEEGPFAPAHAPPASQVPAPIPTLPVMEPTARISSGPAVRRESCLECGVDLTERQRVQTCADCGSLLCSANCYREHRYHSHSRKRRPRKEVCDVCGSTARPYEVNVISQAGWITFALLLVFFFPLFWIGLLITEPRVKCSDCGAYLD